MNPTLACLALAFVGVDLGYRPAPQGGLEYIVQLDPNTLRTLQPGDPISLDVPRNAQQFRPSLITLSLGSTPPPRSLPAAKPAPAAAAPPFQSAPPTGAPPYHSPPPGSIYAPATAPIVPASPVPNSPVLPATATMPLTSPNGSSAGAADGSEPVRVAPPSGPAVAPTTGDPQSLPGQSRIETLPQVGGNTIGAMSIDGMRLLLYLVIIALAAYSGYVSWLLFDARQRYIGLLSQTFAAAK